MVPIFGYPCRTRTKTTLQIGSLVQSPQESLFRIPEIKNMSSCNQSFVNNYSPSSMKSHCFCKVLPGNLRTLRSGTLWNLGPIITQFYCGRTASRCGGVVRELGLDEGGSLCFNFPMQLRLKTYTCLNVM